jgi:probable phosphoglycerate mutase
MARVIFIRHGETIWNVEGREMGQLDSPLTERGIRQAEAIATRLSAIGFSTLYSSDLGRARQTAEHISSKAGNPIVEDVELRERHMGIFQGLTRSEMKEKYPNEWAGYSSTEKFTYVIPNGESQEQRLERSISVMNRLAETHPEESIVVVSHGGILRGFFEYVLGLAPGNERRFKRRNATFNCFAKQGGAWSLEVWGDTSHLEGAG